MDKILIEIVCPATSKKYDFWISKKLSVEKAKEKLIQEIRSYEKNKLMFCDEKNTILFSGKNQRMLVPQLTMEQAGVHSGDSLMLI